MSDKEIHFIFKDFLRDHLKIQFTNIQIIWCISGFECCIVQALALKYFFLFTCSVYNYKRGKLRYKSVLIVKYFNFQVWPFSFQQHIDNKQLATVSLNQWLSRGDSNDIYLHTQSSSTKNINNFMSNSSAHGWQNKRILSF